MACNRYTIQKGNDIVIYDSYELKGYRRTMLYSKLLPNIKIPTNNPFSVMDLTDITYSCAIKEGDNNFNGILYRDMGIKLLYDEFTYTGINIDGQKVIAKYNTNNPKVISEFTLDLNKSTTFSGHINTVKLTEKVTYYNGTVVKHSSFVNGQSTLDEYYDLQNSLIHSKCVLSDGTIITYDLIPNKDTFGKYHFGNIDYKVTLLVTKSQSEINKFRKNSFKQGRILLPKSEMFTSKLNMKYLETADYQVIDDIESLKVIYDFITTTLPKDYVLSVDAETTGLNFYKFYPEDKKSHLVTLSISWREGQSIIIPFRMRYEKNIDIKEALPYLKPILEDYPILCHNGAADVRFCLEDDIDINLQEDTLLLMKVVVPFAAKPEFFGSSMALDDLVRRMFGYDMLDLEKYIFSPSGADFDFSVLNRDYMIAYGCPDTDLCRRLWTVLRKKLPEHREFMYKELVKFSKNIGKQSHYAGMGIDIEKVLSSKEDSMEILDAIQKSIHTITSTTPRTFKIHSGSDDIKRYFMVDKKIPIEQVRMTPAGEVSIDKVVLDRLSSIPRSANNKEEYNTYDIVDKNGEIIRASDDIKMELTKDNLDKLEYPVAKLLRTYHNYMKDVTAYYNNLLNNSYEGIIYPDFRAGNLNTWRTPAGIQTTKNSLKYNMGAPKIENRNFGWCTVDFATEEVRLAANQSYDIPFISMMQHPEADVHTLVASDLYGKSPAEVTKGERGEAKASNFSIIYGALAKSLAKNMFRVDVLTDEQYEAGKRVHSLYCYKRSKMLQPLKEEKKFVSTYGWQENKLKAPMIYSQVIDKARLLEDAFNPNKTGTLEVVVDDELRNQNLFSLLNASGNYPIQSWAAVILMIIYNNLCERVKEDGYYEYIKLPLLVHDEVGLWFDLDVVHPYYIITLLMDCMCLDFRYLNKEVAPLYIGIGFGFTWGKAKGDEAELPVRLQARMYQEFKNGTAPSIEEIKQEGLYEHFVRRKKEYIIERARCMFSNEISNKTFEFNVCMYKLNQDLFIQKQLNEFFKIYTKTSNGLELNVESLVKVLSLDVGDVNIYKGNPIEQPKEKDTSDITEFFFIDYDIHERVSITDKRMVINVTGLTKLVQQEILKYLKSLEDTSDYVHNKIVCIKNNLKREDLDFKVKGIPTNFNTIFTKILNQEITFSDVNKLNNIEILDEYPIEYKNGTLNINAELFNSDNKLKPKLLLIIKEISRYSSNNGKTEVLISGQSSGIKIHLGVDLQQKIDDILRKEVI